MNRYMNYTHDTNIQKKYTIKKNVIIYHLKKLYLQARNKHS